MRTGPSRTKPLTQITPDQRLDFRLPRESDLIIEERSSMLRWKNASEPAAPLGSRLIVQLTFDDVDDLAGHLAEEANPLCGVTRGGARW